jgi:hypothetical protein
VKLTPANLRKFPTYALRALRADYLKMAQGCTAKGLEGGAAMWIDGVAKLDRELDRRAG